MLGFHLTSAVLLSTVYLISNRRRYLSTGYLERNRRRHMSTGYPDRNRRRYRQCFVLPSIHTCLTFGLPKYSDRKNKNYPKEFSPRLT